LQFWKILLLRNEYRASAQASRKFITGELLLVTMTDIDPYVKKAEAKIEELNAELQKLKAKAKSKGADAEIQFNQVASEYEKKKGDLEKRVKDLKASSGVALKDVHEGVDRAIDELGAAFEKARSRFP